ncbi:hypothetical protein DFS34DRAFT_619512 [Phlyctochytrium arcticum]|nr:hypothetical protein DFS34DRAFT_619512 [Phlyctochytrium arcticum]
MTSQSDFDDADIDDLLMSSEDERPTSKPLSIPKPAAVPSSAQFINPSIAGPGKEKEEVKSQIPSLVPPTTTTKPAQQQKNSVDDILAGLDDDWDTPIVVPAVPAVKEVKSEKREQDVLPQEANTREFKFGAGNTIEIKPSNTEPKPSNTVQSETRAAIPTGLGARAVPSSLAASPAISTTVPPKTSPAKKPLLPWEKAAITVPGPSTLSSPNPARNLDGKGTSGTDVFGSPGLGDEGAGAGMGRRRAGTTGTMSPPKPNVVTNRIPSDDDDILGLLDEVVGRRRGGTPGGADFGRAISTPPQQINRIPSSDNDVLDLLGLDDEGADRRQRNKSGSMKSGKSGQSGDGDGRPTFTPTSLPSKPAPSSTPISKPIPSPTRQRQPTTTSSDDDNILPSFLLDTSGPRRRPRPATFSTPPRPLSFLDDTPPQRKPDTVLPFLNLGGERVVRKEKGEVVVLPEVPTAATTAATAVSTKPKPVPQPQPKPATPNPKPIPQTQPIPTPAERPTPDSDPSLANVSIDLSTSDAESEVQEVELSDTSTEEDGNVGKEGIDELKAQLQSAQNRITALESEIRECREQHARDRENWLTDMNTKIDAERSRVDIEVDRRVGIEVQMMKAEHELAMAKMQQAHVDELSKTISNAETTRQLSELTQQVADKFKSVDELKGSVESERVECLKERETAVHAREALLSELQIRVQDQSRQVDAERIKFQDLIARLEATLLAQKAETERIKEERAEEIAVLKREKAEMEERAREERTQFWKGREEWGLERKKMEKKMEDERQGLMLKAAQIQARERALTELEQEMAQQRKTHDEQMSTDRLILDQEIQALQAKSTLVYRQAALTRTEKMRVAALRSRVEAERDVFECSRSDTERDVKAAQSVKEAAVLERQRAQELEVEVRDAREGVSRTREEMEKERTKLEELRRRFYEERMALAVERHKRGVRGSSAVQKTSAHEQPQPQPRQPQDAVSTPSLVLHDQQQPPPPPTITHPPPPPVNSNSPNSTRNLFQKLDRLVGGLSHSEQNLDTQLHYLAVSSYRRRMRGVGASRVGVVM